MSIVFNMAKATLDVKVERLVRNSKGSFDRVNIGSLRSLYPLIMKTLPKTGDDSMAIIDYEARQSVEEMAEGKVKLPSKVFYDVDIVDINEMGEDGTVGTMVVGYQFYGRR